MDEPPSKPLLQIASDVDPKLLLSFAIIFVLLLLVGWISTTEVALFSLQKDDLDRCRSSGTSRDKRLNELMSSSRKLVVTILLVKAAVTIGLITFSTFLSWWTTQAAYPGTGITLVAISLIVYLTVFGEIIPRAFAIRNGLHLARISTGFWTALVWILTPVTLFAVYVSDRFKKVLKKNVSATDELGQALELAASTPDTTEEEKEILKGIVNFRTLTVRQIMRPASEIDSASIGLNFHELLRLVSGSGYSRLPVYGKSLDQIEGVLYIKDLLPFMEQGAAFEWQKLLRSAFFVSQTRKIDLLLKDFQEKHIHIAIVTDNKGKTAGLITLEDVIEEIIGDIHDESDELAVQK